MISACFCGKRTKTWLHGCSLKLFLFPRSSSVFSCPRSLPNAFRFSHWWLGACAKPLQSCPTLCDSMDCSPPGSSVHGISEARILEWVTVSFSWVSDWENCKTEISLCVYVCISVCVCVCLKNKSLIYCHSRYLAPGTWRRQWHPTPVLLPGKSHGWRSLVGYSP